VKRPESHPLRVLIAPDKFKGTLTADRAARAIAHGWRQARPGDSLDLLPMSDGGDGFGPVLGRLLQARTRAVATVDAAHRPCRANWWWAPNPRIALTETAQSNGLARLPKGRFHPFDLDTFGIGRLVEAALRAGARTCILGIGGSATNDGGFGLARALGWRFLDRKGSLLDRWTQLDRLARIDPPVKSDSRLQHCQFVVATDVSNPLLGPRGASRVYGPQKGLTPPDIQIAERCLFRLASVVRKEFGIDSRQPGCGAAGGLGFGLQAFLKARRRLGFDLFSEHAGLERRIANADLVISAEGCVDASTLMGKGVGQLLRLCARHGKPVILFGGRLQLGPRTPKGLLAAISLVEYAGEHSAMHRAESVLRRAACDIARTARTDRTTKDTNEPA
jgi:glycerate kinase